MNVYIFSYNTAYMKNVQINAQYIKDNIEKYTANLLSKVLEFNSPIDKLLSQFFKEHRQLGINARKKIAQNIYLVVRNREFPQWLLDVLKDQYSPAGIGYLIKYPWPNINYF